MKPKYWNKGKIYLSNKDRVLKNIIKNFNHEYLNLNSNYYHALLNSIIGQQISVSAANSVKNKFFKLKKNITPKSVKSIKMSDFRKCGLSRQKIQYIRNLTNFFNNNNNFIKKMKNNDVDEIEIRETLLSIKGIGNWTVDMFLIFSFGNQNIAPTGDLGFNKAISILYNKKLPISDSYLKKKIKLWDPFNSMATWYLWRALDPVPISY